MVQSAAIVGFGSAGRRALHVIQEISPTTKFLVITSQVVSEPGLAVAATFNEVLDFDPDVVVIAGPATMRRESVDVLALSSASFFIEKPLAHSLSDATAIAHILCNSSKIQVGYNLRFSKSLTYFREQIHAATFGRVLSVRAETGQYLPDWRPDSDYRNSVSARAELGGGVLRELSHELDYLRWIFGPIEWVSGWVGKTSDLDIDVDDMALITLGFSGPERSSSLIGSVALDFVRRDRTRSLTVLCEKATLRWDGVAGRVEVSRSGFDDWELLVADEGTVATYRAQWEHFLAQDKPRESLAATLEDGVEVVRVIEAIELSHLRGGARVALADVVCSS